MQPPPIKGVAALYSQVELVVPVESQQLRGAEAVVTEALARGITCSREIRASRRARRSNGRRGAAKARLGSADVRGGGECLFNEGIERRIRVGLPPGCLWPFGARGSGLCSSRSA